ncbi:hypothetical protein, partial [Allofournierella massiliensis]
QLADRNSFLPVGLFSLYNFFYTPRPSRGLSLHLSKQTKTPAFAEHNAWRTRAFSLSKHKESPQA